MNPLKKTLLAALVLALAAVPAARAQSDSEMRAIADPQQAIDVKYRLFKTENIYTFLLLDTSTGKAWQVQFSIDESKAPRTTVPINEKSLVRDGEVVRNGRFTLYPTQDTFNFMLVDQDTGRIFQCLWSLGKERAIFPVLPFPEDGRKY
jgi:hypothetical protein